MNTLIPSEWEVGAIGLEGGQCRTRTCDLLLVR